MTHRAYEVYVVPMAGGRGWVHVPQRRAERKGTKGRRVAGPAGWVHGGMVSGGAFRPPWARRLFFPSSSQRKETLGETLNAHVRVCACMRWRHAHTHQWASPHKHAARMRTKARAYYGTMYGTRAHTDALTRHDSLDS